MNNEVAFTGILALRHVMEAVIQQDPVKLKTIDMEKAEEYPEAWRPLILAVQEWAAKHHVLLFVMSHHHNAGTGTEVPRTHKPEITCYHYIIPDTAFPDLVEKFEFRIVPEGIDISLKGG